MKQNMPRTRRAIAVNTEVAAADGILRGLSQTYFPAMFHVMDEDMDGAASLEDWNAKCAKVEKVDLHNDAAVIEFHDTNLVTKVVTDIVESAKFLPKRLLKALGLEKQMGNDAKRLSVESLAFMCSECSQGALAENYPMGGDATIDLARRIQLQTP